jgi:hypothetical protein
MVLVPIDADPRQRAWRQLMRHVGLSESTPMPAQRASPGTGIGPTISGRESDPAPRPKPPATHMRSEMAERIWPGLRR